MGYRHRYGFFNENYSRVCERSGLYINLKMELEEEEMYEVDIFRKRYASFEYILNELDLMYAELLELNSIDEFLEYRDSRMILYFNTHTREFLLERKGLDNVHDNYIELSESNEDIREGIPLDWRRVTKEINNKMNLEER